jgi:hypothetical protein
MRRIALATVILAAFASAPASAHETIVGAPITHGPDPKAITGGPAKTTRLAKALPSSWCGTPQPTDDTLHELDNGPYRYHAVYAVAADAPDRFAQLAPTLQQDAFGASALLETTYGRAIRFDLGTSCGPQYLDISVVRMPQTQAELAARASERASTERD